MIERLSFNRVSNTDTLLIDLHNGYSVIASGLYVKKENRYHIKFYIKDNTTDILDLIERQEDVVFETDKLTINSAVLKHVATMLSNGFYDYYINRYKYMMKCFDKGHEFFENERLNNAG
jgi:hypothetical protein